MKVLIINGSPRANGNTDIALREMEKVFAEEGVETKRLNIGTQMIHGCVACNACHRTGKCGFDDVVNRAADILRDFDGLVVGTPVYYASANGTVVSFLDRLFYSVPYDLTMKVGASVAVARRGGTSATFDELNKYFTISGMPVVSSQYWNSVHGCRRSPDDANSCAEHDVPDEKHRSRKGKIRSSGEGRARWNEFYSLTLWKYIKYCIDFSPA